MTNQKDFKLQVIYIYMAWGIITGASSGIGKAFVYELASKRRDLVIISRRKKILEGISRDIKAKYSVKVKVITGDLSLLKDLLIIKKKIELLDEVSILVNNAGFGQKGYFHESNEKKSINMVDVHVRASVFLTRVVLPKMVKKGKGSIINLSSIASKITDSSVGVMYHSTKAFLNEFSISLQNEMNHLGVDIRVQALCPGLTQTNFHNSWEFRDFDQKKTPKFIWMQPYKVVKLSLKALEKRKTIYIPGLANKIFIWLINQRVTSAIMKLFFRNIRR